MNARNLRKALSLCGVAAVSAVLFSATAQAEGCPADKRVAGGAGQKMSDAKAAGVTDTVIGAINLANEPVAIKDRTFRLRKLVVEPGGVVPWHSHGDRPAIIYIVSGEITEYASTCAVPILHKAGEATEETHETAHWWKNLGTTTVVLLSADLLHAGGGDDHVM
ncbi:MAG TPA: cupin domain-containing protein [Acetobacteraceae bacterium]|nr:cupin domain-containing protein [Acetobacteraceae bacterium]